MRIRSSGRSIWANEARPMMNSQSLALDVSALSAGYGRFDVVHDIALKVGAGEAVALLGPNGAGKTTVLKSIMGLVSQRRGSIRVAGEDVSAVPAHRVARGFAAIAPEGRRLFLDQTVEDNLLLGGLHLRRDRGTPSGAFEVGLRPVSRPLRVPSTAFVVPQRRRAADGCDRAHVDERSESDAA